MFTAAQKKSKIKKILLVGFAAFFVFVLAFILVFLFKQYYQPLYNFEKTENNNGVYREYYVNGQLKSFEEYFKGQRNGKSVYFNQKGDTLESFEFYLGERHGESRYFTKNGDLVVLDIYDLGKLIYHKITNDSLYLYEYKAFDTGLLSFEQSCAECHSSNDEIVNFKDTSLTINSLDTLHLCLLDTIENTNTKANYYRINTQELNTIKYFIDILKDSKNEQKQQFRINRNQKKRIVIEEKRP